MAYHANPTHIPAQVAMEPSPAALSDGRPRGCSRVPPAATDDRDDPGEGEQEQHAAQGARLLPVFEFSSSLLPPRRGRGRAYSQYTHSTWGVEWYVVKFSRKGNMICSSTSRAW